MWFILQNFLKMLGRYRMSALLNVMGLTAAFASFYVIMSQVWWELSFNKSIEDSDRIGVVEMPLGDWTNFINRPFPEQCLPKIPQVEHFGCLQGRNQKLWSWDEARSEYVPFDADGALVSQGFFPTSSLQIEQGSAESLIRPNTLIISRRIAEERNLKVGDKIHVAEEKPSEENACEVVAIFRNFEDNTSWSNLDFFQDIGDNGLNDMSEWSFNYFVKVAEGDSVMEQVKARFVELAREQRGGDDDMQDLQISMTPLADFYFDGKGEAEQSGSRITTFSLLMLALLVIVLAFINFVNFFFALVPVRIRTVNTCMIFGASRLSLRFGFIFEAMGLVAISLGLAALCAYLFQSTDLARHILLVSLELKENMGVALVVAGVGFVLSLVASLYPSWYITSFNPGMVVKGSFAGTKSGVRLRMVLLGVQFMVSCSLIVATAFILLQYRFLLNHDLGLDTRNVLTFNLRANDNMDYATLRGELSKLAGVEAVTVSNTIVFSKYGMGWGRTYKGKQIFMRAYEVRPDFLDFMGIDIVDGRGPRPGDVRQDKLTPENEDTWGGVTVVNERFARECELEIGKFSAGFYEGDRLIGVCRDFSYMPLCDESDHVVLYVTPKQHAESRDRWGMQIYVRHPPTADVADLSRRIRGVIKQVDPNQVEGSIEIKSFDEIIADAYRKEARLSKVFAMLSGISIIIALMGVFGIVMFETRRARHEIAVRKAIGATVPQILEQFCTHYVRMILLSFVLVIPPTVWGLHHWLQSYAFRTPLHWWVFLGALVLVMAVTLLTVIVRSWHAACENPVNALKKE